MSYLAVRHAHSVKSGIQASVNFVNKPIKRTIMKIFSRSLATILIFVLALSGCSDDSSISSSGGGSLASDGGATSAQYAGTYRGNTSVHYVGDGIDDTDSFPTTVVINKDGTASVTIEGETVSGVMNGNKLEVPVKLTKNEDGITCKGTMLIKATVSGANMSGPVTGDAECSLLLIKRTATMTGSLSAKKS